MIEQLPNDDKTQEFLLKDQLNELEISTLQFLFNSQFQIARQSLEERIAIHTQIKKYQRSVSMNPDQLRRLFNALSQKLHQKFIRQDSNCLKALNKLQTLWQVKKIQIFHRYYFERYIETTYLKNIQTLIRNEDHLIRMDQHIYFSIEKTLWARQACLNHLKRQLRVLGPQDMYQHLQTVKDRQLEKNRKMEQKLYKVYGFRAKYILDERETKLGVTKMQLLSEDINNYRKLTYHLIELISNWKLYIQSLTHDLRLRKQKIEFYHQDNNHLLTILNDSSFISTSFLTNFYTFAIKNDPFLLKPILNLEKPMQDGAEITFEAHHFKNIINCKMQDVPKIVFALNQLYKEVQWNLIHKKYTEKNGLLKFKSANLERLASERKLPSMKSVKLSQLQPQTSIKKSSSQPKRQKINLFTKSNVLQRQTSLLSNLAITNNTIQEGKKFRINNPQTKNPFKLFENEELKVLKEEIYNKVKQDLDHLTKKSIIQSPEFANLIEEEVRASFKKHLNNQEQEILRNNLQITPLSFTEQQVNSHITQIYRQIPFQYANIQTLQNDLLKEIHEVNYSYILKVHTNTLEVANVVGFCNRNIKQFKSIEIKLISFKFEDTFEKIVLKIVQFLWKYDNAKQIAFSLRSNNQQTQKFIKQFSKKMELNCTIIEKKYKVYVETRFIFTNKEFNKRFVFNPYPQKVNFKLYSALCLQRVQLQSLEVEQLGKYLSYDYLIMQILRKFTNSEDFYILRDIFRPKDRFRFLLNQIMEIQNHKDFEIDMSIFEEQNLTNLYQKLKYAKKPLLQVSDLILINNIKMIQLEYTLTVAYRLHILSPGNGQNCHRYAIHEEISCMRDAKGTQFYLLPVQESQHLKIILFSAENYMSDYKKGLNMYLFQTLEKHKWEKRHVESMWIEMVRYPQNYTEREQFLLSTYRVQDLSLINKELLIGDAFDWFTDIQIQNGIKYVLQKSDIHLKMPLGVGIVTNKNWVLYARVIQGN